MGNLLEVPVEENLYDCEAANSVGLTEQELQQQIKEKGETDDLNPPFFTFRRSGQNPITNTYLNCPLVNVLCDSNSNAYTPPGMV